MLEAAALALRCWERGGTGPDPRAEASLTGPRELVNNYLGFLVWVLLCFILKEGKAL